MNWVDLAIILSLLYFTFEGFKKSFIAESFNFLSFLLALILSLRFYNVFSRIVEANLKLPHSLANVVGFVGVWFLVETIFFSLIHYFFKPGRITMLIDSKLCHLSVIPSFLRGLIFISVMLVMVGTFPIQPKVKLEISQSKFGSLILERTQQLEGPLKNIFGQVANDSLAFFTVEPQTSESINLGFSLNEFRSRADLEAEMIDLVNQERLKRNLNLLSFDPKLQSTARYQSEDMFKRGYFSHYSPEGENVANRAAKFGVDYLVIGENLAYAPNLQLAHQGLMNSPGHRANILSNQFQKIGIGIMDGGVYGLMITQVFSN